jgi:hypothetical protein
MAADKDGGGPKVLPPEQVAKLKQIDMQPIFASGFQIQGTGTDFTLFFQQTRALVTDAGEFTAHAKREVVAAIALSPHALKDLTVLLSNTMAGYEKMYGALETDYTKKLAAQKKA